MSATAPHPRRAARAVLRPGTPVVRRDADTLQVGLTSHSVRLPDRAEVRALLAALRTGTEPPPPTVETERAWSLLRAAGLAIDPAPVGPVGPAGPAAQAAQAAQAQFGADAGRRLAARAAHRVGVRADPPTREALAGLLASAGLVTDDPDDPHDADNPGNPGNPGNPDNSAPDVWLVVTAGPVLRADVDPLQRAGVPHLLVTGDGVARRVGPLVEPGRTACLRCVDAHEAESDPRRPFLLEQAAAAAEATWPVDPVLDRWALAWAVRDLTRYLEGDEPSTWSTTIDLGPTEAPVVVRHLRHPHCGCSWDVLLDLP